MRASRAEQWLWPITALAVAAWLRLSELGLTRFTSDQSNLLGTVRRLVRFGEWPLFGPDIGPGLYGWGRLGPIHFYLSAPAFALSDGSPRAVIGALAAAHVVTVALTIRAGQRFLGVREGWLAGLLLAVAPYPVFISRELVNFAFIPPFAALLLLALLEIGSAGRRWWLVAALPCLAATVQLHATAWAYAPLLLLACFAARVPWRRLALPALAGTVLALVLAAPYLRGLVGEGFSDLSRFLEAVSSRGGDGGVTADPGGGLDPAPLRLAFGLMDLQPHPPLIEGALSATTRLLAPLAIALGLVVCTTRAARGARGGAASAWHTPVLLVAWFAAPALALTTFRDEVYIRHLVVLLPVPALLAAVPLAAASRALERRGARRAALVPALAGVALAATLAASTLGYRDAVRDERWIASGVPLADQERVADFLVEDEGFTWESHRRLHLPGLGDSRYGLRYLIEERTDPTRSPELATGGPHYVLHHAAQQPRCEALPTVTPILDLGPLALGRYPSAVVPGSQRYVLPDGRELEELPFGTETARGRARYRVELDPTGGETGTWVVVTNGCVDRVRLDAVELHRGDCAWRPIGEPWPVSHGFALPGGAGGLEIEVLVPAGRLHLDGYDLPYRVLPDPRAPGAPFSWGTITLHPLASAARDPRPADGSRYLE